MNWTLEDAATWFERVYERTLEVARAVPEAKLEWRPAENEFTCGDLIRHIASTEVMNMARLGSGPLRYPGHAESFGRSKAEVIAYLESCHGRAVEMLQANGEAGLTMPVPTNQGNIAGWRVLVGMIEHEIHHRSQLCSYLSQLGIAPPALYGLYVEELPAD
ncbi:MAG TPA: DinB family protein [Chloroflexia bacterium]|nr:DinB family protein [Chloroflexia bacterium]